MVLPHETRHHMVDSASLDSRQHGLEVLRSQGQVTLAGDMAAHALDDWAVASALYEQDDIVEIDCNPVVIRTGKPTVVDALVVTRSSSSTCGSP